MNHTRERLAQEAARILLEYGEVNPDLALRKAAKRLGVQERRLWPSRAELEAVIKSEHRLFAKPTQADTLQRMRREALGLMRLLADFRPKLSGVLLQDYAGPKAPIELHLFCERSEDVMFRLMELGIRYKTASRGFRYPDGTVREHPALLLEKDDLLAELLCFALAEERGAAPVSSLDQTPLQRLSISGLETLLSKDA